MQVACVRTCVRDARRFAARLLPARRRTGTIPSARPGKKSQSLLAARFDNAPPWHGPAPKVEYVGAGGHARVLAPRFAEFASVEIGKLAAPTSTDRRHGALQRLRQALSRSWPLR